MNDNDSLEQHILKTLVPVNELTSDHLRSLMRNHAVEAVCKGQMLFDVGDCDNNNVYLLSGTVKLVGKDDTGETSTRFLNADDPEARFALAHHQPRRCRADAHSDCSVIRFNSDRLDAMLAWDQAAQYIILDISSRRDLDEDADWMLTLLKSNLFYKVPPMNIRQILNKFESVCLSSGDTVLRQGEIGDGCYIIKEGIADVTRSKAENQASELVAQLGVGRCFGEDALVNDTVRNATVVMHTNGVLKKLNKKDFFLLLKPVDIVSVKLLEAKQRIDRGAIWVDVRTQDEFEQGHCDGALHMPLNLLKLKSRLLDKQQEYILYCNSGRRSSAAAHLLGEDGFTVCVLDGGFTDYAEQEEGYFGQTA